MLRILQLPLTLIQDDRRRNLRLLLDHVDELVAAVLLYEVDDDVMLLVGVSVDYLKRVASAWFDDQLLVAVGVGRSGSAWLVPYAAGVSFECTAIDFEVAKDGEFNG